jgi:hypothetical protein
MRTSAPVGRTLLLAAAFCSGEALGEGAPATEPGPYAAIDGCPTAVDWLNAVRARLPTSLRDHPALRRFTLRLRRTGDEGGASFEGELGTAGEPVASRTLRGSACAEVADALTLVAAMEIQRVAYLEGPAPSALELADEASARVEPADSSLEPRRERERASSRIGVVGFAVLQSVTAPRWGTDLGLGLSVEWPARLWQPWMMLGGYWGRDSEAVGGGSAEARFQRWAALLVGCPLRYPVAASLTLRPCGSLEAGTLSGSGRAVGAPAQSTALLANAGLEARLEWRMSEHVQLSALLGGVAALSRPRFFFAPDHTALSVPALGLRTGASAGLSF